MDNELTNALWMQFVTEMEKRLGAVERMLEAAGNSNNGDIRVRKLVHLFTLFSSIEGLSKSMWMLAVEMRFYSSKELLVDVLLDEKNVLDASHVSLLVNAVDEMKVLHEKAMIKYADISPFLPGRMYGDFAEAGVQTPAKEGATEAAQPTATDE